jgi:hypothetical protein
MSAQRIHYNSGRWNWIVARIQSIEVISTTDPNRLTPDARAFKKLLRQHAGWTMVTDEDGWKVISPSTTWRIK